MSDQAAFDIWLHRELSRMYDAALHDPIPEPLMQLLAEHSAEAPHCDRRPA